MKSRIIIEVETSDIRKIMEDTPEHDPELDQVVDENLSKRFEKAIHRAIASEIERYSSDDYNERLAEDVFENLDFDWDVYQLSEDGDLSELGTIKITITTEDPEE